MTKDIDLDSSNEKLIGVTKDIVEKFLENLEATDLPPEIVSGLRETLVENGKRSEKVLLAAIFPSSET